LLREKKRGRPEDVVSLNPTKEVIPMKKRICRRMPVNDFQPDSISLADLGGKLVSAIDVAKVDMVAALATADGRVLQTISWKAPDENPRVLEILRGFRSAGIPVEPVMEPSGTYGDVLRHQLEQDGFPLFMVSGKRTFDARELFDGVPSLHDAKSAAIIARLHALLAAYDFAPHYRVSSLAEIFVSSRPGPSTAALPVVFTCTRPNVSTNTQNASRRYIQPRNAVITG
jgi:hypothetical protein